MHPSALISDRPACAVKKRTGLDPLLPARRNGPSTQLIVRPKSPKSTPKSKSPTRKKIDMIKNQCSPATQQRHDRRNRPSFQGLSIVESKKSSHEQ